MVRTIFIGYNCEEDTWRAELIRRCLENEDFHAYGFWDPAFLEQIKKEGKEAIRQLINMEFKGAEATIVLIGRYTYDSPWIEYEIRKSHIKEKPIIGIYIHNIRKGDGETCEKGRNPFNKIIVNIGGRRDVLANHIPVYDWIEDDGRANIRKWIQDVVTETSE
jgi:hypothetical protein